MISEVMLQQTQVPRVKEKYKEFLKAFPNVRALAKAPLSKVLQVWSGLGYNRRAKFLHDAAKEIVRKHRGRVPLLYSELVELPGIGDYTASAIRVFAFNEPDVLIETNVRAAFIHHFYTQNRHKVSDRELLRYIAVAAEDQDPRKWHSALMDYGVHLKKLHKNPARKSAHYVRQSKFEGSLRQVRGAILRAHAKQTSMNAVRNEFPDRFDEAFRSLVRDGLITKSALLHDAQELSRDRGSQMLFVSRNSRRPLPQRSRRLSKAT